MMLLPKTPFNISEIEKKLKTKKHFTSLHFFHFHFTSQPALRALQAGGRRSVARSDESGLSTARARLAAARARLGAVRARLDRVGGFAAKRPPTRPPTQLVY